MSQNLVNRQQAAQATLDEFHGKDFELGKYDCAKMVNFYLRLIGQPIAIQRCGTYTTVLGAKRGMKRMGFDHLREVMDAKFVRINPSQALMGDVFELETEDDDPIGALALYLGNGLTLGYHEAATGAVTARLLQPPINAWRVL